MLWRRDALWTYNAFDLDVPSNTFGSHGAFVDLWRDKAGGRIAPDWSDFDIMDLEPWWGWMTVYDVVPGDEIAFHVRLWGTKIVETLDYDLTGKTLTLIDVGEVSDAKHVTTNDLEFADYLIRHAKIGYGHGPIDAAYGERPEYHDILLPLSSDGASMDKLVYMSWLERVSTVNDNN